MNIANNLLKSNTPYMLRKDGALLECGEAHPYIKYYFDYDDSKNMEELDKHPSSLEWFYNNTLNDEVKQLINEYKTKKDVDSFNKLNDLLSNEFCRVRTSNIRYKYGGDNGEVYFRISSKDFNWFDIIWQIVMNNKDNLKYVTIVKDYQTFGKQFDYYKHNDKELKHIPVDEFLTLKGNPILEKIVKKGSKWQVQSEKGRNLGTYDTKEEAEKRLKQVEYFKYLDESKTTGKFELGKAGYIKEDGSFIILDEYHGEDESLWPFRYPEFSNTHPEEDTCIRIWRKPTDAQYEALEMIINKYLDNEEYCKIEINNDFYHIYSLRSGACQDIQWNEEVGNWDGYKLVKLIKNYFSNKLIEKIGEHELKDFKNMETRGKKLCYLIWNYIKDKLKGIHWSGFFSVGKNGKIGVASPSSLLPMSSFMKEQFIFEFTDDGLIWISNAADLSEELEKELGKEDAQNFLEEYSHPQDLETILNNNYYNPLQDIVESTDNLVDYLKENNLLEEKLNLTESLLLEKKRSELISKSKSGANYKSKDRQDQNRWDRRKYSKLSTNVSDYNRIDMNTFWKEDILEFGIKVQGETDNYVVTVTFEKILERLRDEIARNNNKLEFKNVLRSLINTFNSEDVYVECNCLDFTFGGFNYYSYRQGYNSNPQFGPAMDKPIIKNPMDNLGAACKHINLVLSNLTWMMKIASVINNYIWYCKDNMEINYAKYIFPKLYGMDYDKAIQLSLFDTDELETDEATINMSNMLGRRRTQYKPKPEPSINPRFERERKEKPESNPLKLQFNDEVKEEEEIKIKEPEPEIGNEDEIEDES